MCVCVSAWVAVRGLFLRASSVCHGGICGSGLLAVKGQCNTLQPQHLNSYMVCISNGVMRGGLLQSQRSLCTFVCVRACSLLLTRMTFSQEGRGLQVDKCYLPVLPPLSSTSCHCGSHLSGEDVLLVEPNGKPLKCFSNTVCEAVQVKNKTKQKTHFLFIYSEVFKVLTKYFKTMGFYSHQVKKMCVAMCSMLQTKILA